ncbi:slowpoke-binding protein isoform X1 [Microplitis demolitor]|uniref:slowpoke-binding protein isoform X1 n=1 Tax=Microplitis demolitor TaxID=69319 RepID=UPI0004CD9962|nr:slowpoke-binding protein isoform X1 [Microplitis demolitor]
MFSIYQQLNKKDEDSGGSRRGSDCTGHDRFYQEPTRVKRKKRPPNRRTRSAIELDSNAMLTARNYVKNNRSTSIESTTSNASTSSSSINNLSEDKFQFVNKIDSLAKILFNRVSITRSRDSESSNGKHHYESLEQNPTIREEGIEYLELEKKSRDQALNICQVYLQATTRYNLANQLYNIGSRVDKFWFVVTDTLLKTDRLLTLTPLSKNCPLSVCPSTKEILNKLFLFIQHPYVCPILDIEFIEYEEENYVIILQPINHGCLKDLIYGIDKNSWNNDWTNKYVSRGNGLILPQIQVIGRQILEALLFLKDRGYPTIHLHSGNVAIQNGMARVAGLENSLLGFTSRIYPLVSTRAPYGTCIESICFGHLLFEMTTGYELCSFKPSRIHYDDVAKFPLVYELMEFIFNSPDNRYPSLEEILLHELFRNIDLRELRHAPVNTFRPILNPSVVNLLEDIKRHNSRRITSIEEIDLLISI